MIIYSVPLLICTSCSILYPEFHLCYNIYELCPLSTTQLLRDLQYIIMGCIIYLCQFHIQLFWSAKLGSILIYINMINAPWVPPSTAQIAVYMVWVPPLFLTSCPKHFPAGLLSDLQYTIYYHGLYHLHPCNIVILQSQLYNMLPILNTVWQQNPTHQSGI